MCLKGKKGWKCQICSNKRIGFRNTKLELCQEARIMKMEPSECTYGFTTTTLDDCYPGKTSCPSCIQAYEKCEKEEKVAEKE